MAERGKFYDVALLDEIKATCKEAREGHGIVPTHAILHPDDYDEIARAKAWANGTTFEWRDVVIYHHDVLGPDGKIRSRSGSVIVVKDERVPIGRALVCNHEDAFVRGYCDTIGGER